MSLSVAEVCRLLVSLVWSQMPRAEFVLAWSTWRRVHQAIARFYPYKRHRVLVPDLQL